MVGAVRRGPGWPPWDVTAGARGRGNLTAFCDSRAVPEPELETNPRVGSPESRGVLRAGPIDAWLIGAALGLGGLLGCAIVKTSPGVGGFVVTGVAVALSTWWGSNTIAHLHLHRPLWRRRGWNRAFALYLTALLGVPQSIWRARHLWHHAGERAADKPALPRGAIGELLIVAAVWGAIAVARPWLLLLAWLPGYLVGMALCQAQGVHEHAGVGPDGISSYGRLYNLLWFNDGYHVEHHRHPDAHWSELPSRKALGAVVSRLPPVLRWLAPPRHAPSVPRP